MVGGLFLPIWPVGVLFGTISFLPAEAGWQGKLIFALLVAYPVIWGVLTWLSWRVLRKGRAGLAILLSLPPALPLLVLVGYLLYGGFLEYRT